MADGLMREEFEKWMQEQRKYFPGETEYEDCWVAWQAALQHRNKESDYRKGITEFTNAIVDDCKNLKELSIQNRDPVKFIKGETVFGSPEYDQPNSPIDIRPQNPSAGMGCVHQWLGGGSETFQSVHCTKCGVAHPDNFSSKTRGDNE